MSQYITRCQLASLFGHEILTNNQEFSQLATDDLTIKGVAIERRGRKNKRLDVEFHHDGVEIARASFDMKKNTMRFRGAKGFKGEDVEDMTVWLKSAHRRSSAIDDIGILMSNIRTKEAIPLFNHEDRDNVGRFYAQPKTGAAFHI